jgi:hypothetical protein
MNQHPPQDRILFRQLQWKGFRLPMVLDIVAEGFRGAEDADRLAVLDGLYKVDDVDEDAFQVLRKLVYSRAKIDGLVFTFLHCVMEGPTSAPTSLQSSCQAETLVTLRP